MSRIGRLEYKANKLVGYHVNVWADIQIKEGSIVMSSKKSLSHLWLFLYFSFFIKPHLRQILPCASYIRWNGSWGIVPVCTHRWIKQCFWEVHQKSENIYTWEKKRTWVRTIFLFICSDYTTEISGGEQPVWWVKGRSSWAQRLCILKFGRGMYCVKGTHSGQVPAVTCVRSVQFDTEWKQEPANIFSHKHDVNI